MKLIFKTSILFMMVLIVIGSLRINAQKLSVCKSIDNNKNVTGEATSFKLDGTDRELTVIVDNEGKKFNTDKITIQLYKVENGEIAKYLQADKFDVKPTQDYWWHKIMMAKDGNIRVRAYNAKGDLICEETISINALPDTVAKKEDKPEQNIKTTATHIPGQAYTIGEKFGGGIIFYVDSSGQHGLIAAAEDQSAEVKWFNGVYRYTDGLTEGIGAGAKNTAIIVAIQIKDNLKGNFAAKVCADYSVTVDGMTYHDWYLPNMSELDLLQEQKDVVGGFNDYYDGLYWSSSESDDEHASARFISGQSKKDDRPRHSNKSLTNRVRAIRVF